MNETIKNQLEHRTIREFTGERIPEENIKELLEVANRTASSNGMQNYSIIRITDQKIKDEFAEIGKQDYMARATELFIFVVDLYRNYEIAKELHAENDIMIGFDKFMQGFTDGCLAAQNLTVASESLGYGTNYFGNIHNDTKKVIELLKLPKYTYPIVGLGLGVPDQDPQIKPRMPLDLKVFDNSYKVFDSYLESLKGYDKVMETYYDLRDSNKKVESFTKQVVEKQGSTAGYREDMFKTLLEQGFKVK